MPLLVSKVMPANWTLAPAFNGLLKVEFILKTIEAPPPAKIAELPVYSCVLNALKLASPINP